MTESIEDERSRSKFTRIEGPWDKIFPFYVTSIADDDDGLTIFIDDEPGINKGKFNFSKYYGYRNFSESDLYVYLNNGLKIHRSGLYVATDSDFMKWAAESCIIGSLDEKIKHYVIISIDDVIEILAFGDPSFE